MKRAPADAHVYNAPPAKNVRFAPDASHEPATSSVEQPTKTEPHAASSIPAESEELHKLRAENEALRAKIGNMQVTITTLTDLMGNVSTCQNGKALCEREKQNEGSLSSAVQGPSD